MSYEVIQSGVFDAWLAGVRDPNAKAAIFSRLDRVGEGLLGDIKPVGEGVSELRIHHGQGYRLYCSVHGPVLVVLLCGGTKRTQAGDIKLAKKLNKEFGQWQTKNPDSADTTPPITSTARK